MAVGVLVGVITGVTLLCPAVGGARETAGVDPLIEAGAFAEAETLLRRQITDAGAPVVDGPARRLEILRRTRRDFSLDVESLKRVLRRALPDVSDEDLVRWTASGALQHRVIDGEVRYFRKAPRNVFLLSDEARERRDARRTSTRRGFDLDDTLARIVALCEETDEPLLAPIKHTARYRLRVKPGHPRVRTGAVVRAWLPFPQELPQQTDVRLISSTPAAKRIAPSGTPHRTVYFEQTLGDDGAAPTFEIELEFTTFSQYAKLDPERVEPYDTGGELYTRYTAERLPHIAFTPEARQLAAEIIGDETNPQEKARRVFHWVSANIPWVGEMEYGIIPSLSQKGIEARCGDCGVQGLVFVTLCRLAGVPARWQSGWELQPGRWNLHDWSEIYLEPWGWVPVDASYGVRDSDDPRVADFFLGHMDPYRWIINLDYARELDPPKTSFRSEPNDFQRGEVEIDGHNLYFDDWTYRAEFTSERLGW
ncbi:MAG: transglutaminase domain-containing protein [Planctomycetota bacterium]